MSLRTKLLLALSPLLVALGVTLIMGSTTSIALGRSSQRIFYENYRSVLAAQRMKDAVERMDSGAMFIVSGEDARGAQQASVSRVKFEDELRVEEANITEPGEGEATERLRALWATYQRDFTYFASLDRESARAYYFAELLPAFLAVKDGADAILDLNQDAMVKKAAGAERSARSFTRAIIAVGLAGCALALFASSAWMSRLLRPLSVLGAAARRIGEGDLQVKAVVDGTDEVGRLAMEFNTMAERLQKYRKSSLGDLLQAQGNLQAAIDSLPDPVLVAAVDGHLLAVNRAAETLLAIRLEGESTNWLAPLDPSLRETLERVKTHVLAGHGAYLPKGLEEAVLLPGPDVERRLLPRAMPVYDEERTVVGTTIVLQDVTRLSRSDELKNNLVATVAHEFRTPLTSIQMAIHLCTEEAVGPLTEKQADLLHAAREDCQRLQTIVDELLDLSRIQEGKLALHPTTVSAEKLVRDAVHALGSTASTAHVNLSREVLPGVGAVIADAERIQIVLSNLIANAIHHSPAGSTIAARALRVDGWVQFEVADQGSGIPAEHRDAIFEKFYQVAPGSGGGSGLGLSIAKEIVEEHGGAIGVESEPGKGANFWFRLPAVAGAES